MRLRWLCVFLFAVSASSQPRAAASTKGETVVFLHGMGRSRVSMLILSRRFRNAGYQTANFPYNQMTMSLDEITDDFVKFLRTEVKSEKYHLIGHSLGNIIIRNAFAKGCPPGLGRIVMLAPPNHPADLAKRMKDRLLYRWIMGDSGQRLSEEQFYLRLPKPTVEFGVIAGDRGQRLTFDRPNDGIITVDSTKLEGMSDWVLVHHTHTLLMNSRDTFELARKFLESGRFRE